MAEGLPENRVVQVFRMSDRAILPTRGHDTDAGFDISVVEAKSWTNAQGVGMIHGLFHTDLVVVFNDPTYYGELYARSSLAKSGLCLGRPFSPLRLRLIGQKLNQKHGCDVTVMFY
jgi:dUTPase